MDRPRAELYTDGACSGNPGPGGWAYILRIDGEEESCWGGDKQTTNNRMELMSVIEGLRSLREPHSVDVYSDSQYVVNGLSSWIDGWKAKGWKRGKNQPVKNQELWEELDRLREFHDLTCHWVRGHNEHPENERCDRMAVEAIREYR